MKLLIFSIPIFLSFLSVNGYSFTKIYCYRCVSTHPGCGENFNWLWYWSQQCPEENDKCIKITERKGSSTVITRDCLSSLRSFRTDIPADHYEGCRPAAKDVRLAHYVNNSIYELDLKRDYYDSTEWCFCFFDNRCNSSSAVYASVILTLAFSIFRIIVL